MGGEGKSIARVGQALCIILVLAAAIPAFSAEYPRRIAIAPFAALSAQDDVKQTTSILPRLISSRLMALAGAEVVLLPPGDKPPEEAAREAGASLLLQGTVSKLGKGYSIDAAATDLSSGKTAGAFFAAAATEDDIIPQLGAMAGEIAEKLFGVKTARPQPPPAPAAADPVPAAAPVPASGAVAPAEGPTAPGTAARAGPVADEKWVPSSLNKIAESGRISDELHGVVAGDIDTEGNREVIAYGKKGIHLHRVAGKEIRPATRITDGLPDRILNVEAVDLDGDGKRELLVTGIDGDALRSSVWRRIGDIYEKVADRIPWFLVLLPDWQGKEVVAGQESGSDHPFYGKLYAMSWDGKTLKRGEPLPADTLRPPLTFGILGLSSARFGEAWKWIYTDEDDKLRVLAPGGSTEYKTRAKFSWSGDSFEWGLHLPRVGRTRYAVRKAARVSRGPDGRPLLLVPVEEEALLKFEMSSETTRLALLRWSGEEFVEAAGIPKGDRVYSGADFLSPDGLRRGGKAVASVIEQPDSVLKGGLSRLVLFQVE